MPSNPVPAAEFLVHACTLCPQGIPSRLYVSIVADGDSSSDSQIALEDEELVLDYKAVSGDEPDGSAGREPAGGCWNGIVFLMGARCSLQLLCPATGSETWRLEIQQEYRTTFVEPQPALRSHDPLYLVFEPAPNELLASYRLHITE